MILDPNCIYRCNGIWTFCFVHKNSNSDEKKRMGVENDRIFLV